MKYTLQSLNSYLAPVLWWLMPIVIFLFSLLGLISPYAGIVGVALIVSTTYASYAIVLKERAVPSKAVIKIIVLLTIFSSGLLILFLEDILFLTAFVLLTALIQGYTVLHIRNSLYLPEKQVPLLVIESIRLQVILGVFASGAVSFAVIFYFAVGYGITLVPIAMIVIGILFWRLISLYGLQLRDRLLLSAVFLMITIECFIALLWLPLSYMVSGVFLASVFFVYDETVVRFGYKGDMRHHDHKASFLILVGMVVLVVFIASWK